MPKAGPRAPSDPLEDLKQHGPRPVYVVDGEEKLLVDEAVRTIKEHALPKQARDFNFDVFSGRNVTLTRVVEAAEMLPAFAPRRVVLVDHADALLQDAPESEGESRSKNDDAKRRGVERFLAYLERPSPTTVLLLVGDKLDARTKIYKALQKAGVVLRFSRPKPREMPDLIRNRARVMNIPIAEPAIRTLADTVGADVTAAFQALELLSLYVGPGGKKIEPADVEDLVSQTKEESIFELADSIGSRNRASALRGLHAMLSVSREHPLKVLAMIARHWRSLARARSLIDAGVARNDIDGSMLGVPPFKIDDVLGQARRQPNAAFVRGLEAISDADRLLKGGALDGVRVMERLVLQLMG